MKLSLSKVSLFTLGPVLAALISCQTSDRHAASTRFMNSTAENNVLRVGRSNDLNRTLDPHYYYADANLEVDWLIYGKLFEFDEEKILQKNLAVSASASGYDKSVWKIELKKGVKFHHGQTFTKADVLCTFDRIMAYAPYSPSGYSTLLTSIDLEKTKNLNKDPKKTKPYTLFVKTLKPNVRLLDNLASVFIMSCDDTAKAMDVQKATAVPAGQVHQPVLDLFNAGAMVNGTGPYELKQWIPADSKDLPAGVKPVIALKKFAGYHSTKRMPQWNEVQYYTYINDQDRVDALLNGDVDVISNVPTNRIADLQNANFNVHKRTSLRVNFLQMYQTDDQRQNLPEHDPLTDENGNKLLTPVSPFTSKNFRKALAMALDKQRLVQAMDGLAVATEQFFWEGRVGHLASLAKPQYDVQSARKYMAQALDELKYFDDYSNHKLNLALHGVGDRKPVEPRLMETITTMFNEAFSSFEVDGKHYSLNVAAIPEARATFFTKTKKYGFVITGGGIDNGHVSGALRLYMYTKAGLNHGRYSNPKVDQLYDQASVITDNESQSNKLFTEALQTALEDQANIPMFNFVAVSATHPNLMYKPRIDDIIIASDIYTK